MASRSILRALLIIGFCCLFVFMVLAVNIYERNYPVVLERINAIKAESVLLNNSVLSVSSKLRRDFDEISQREAAFSLAGANLVDEIEPGGWRLADWVARMIRSDGGQLPAVPDSVSDLVDQRLNEINVFKTHTAIARNSEMIARQIVTDLYESHRDHLDLSLSYLELSNAIQGAISSNSLTQKPLTIQMIRYVAEQDDIPDNQRALALLERHVDLLFDHRLIVADQLAVEQSLRDQLYAELDNYAVNIARLYHVEEESAGVFRGVVILLVLILTLAMTFLIGRNYRLSASLQLYSAELEGKVEERTLELSREKEDLLLEKQKGESLIQRLEESEQQMVTLINSVHCCIVDFSISTGNVHYISLGVERMWRKDREDISKVEQLRQVIHEDDQAEVEAMLEQIRAGNPSASALYRIVWPGGDVVWLREHCTPRVVDGECDDVVSVIVDVTEAKNASQESERMLQELADAAKMESVGMLAAGIAHEINTPAQFVSDNLQFLKESWAEMQTLVGELCDAASNSSDASLGETAQELCEKADFEYLVEECEPALEQSSEGIASIARIVRAMKEHSHPSTEVEAVDLNHVIENTITVSKGEWKNFATVETDFDKELPIFNCVAGDISQVVLNMIVNSSHALAERQGSSNGEPNTICLRTAANDEEITISVEDNGPGMPEEVRTRVFDHFFTTKEVGRGTGQGLSLAHRVIVDTYGGAIDVESEVDVGTVFTIHLPLDVDMEACA